MIKGGLSSFEGIKFDFKFRKSINVATWRNSLTIFQKVKCRTTIKGSNSICRYLSKGNEYAHTNICTKIFITVTFRKAKNWKQPNVCQWWMYTSMQWNTIQQLKRRQTVETCHIMGKSEKQYTKWKKPDARHHGLYDSIYMWNVQKRPMYYRESRLVVAQKQKGVKDQLKWTWRGLMRGTKML